MWRLFLVLPLLTSCVTAASLTLQITPSNLLPNPNTLPPSTHATITSPDGSTLQAPLQKDNTITFPHIGTVGSHLLSIYAKDYTFASYRIDTEASTTNTPDNVLISFAAQLYPGTQWSDTGVNVVPQQPDASSTTGMAARPQASLTLSPRILGQKQFYEPRPAFSPLSLLKNPMILLAIVALAFTFGMPKLMENMDPEMKAEYEEMQKKGPTAAIGRAMAGQGASSSSDGFDLAGFLAGQKRNGGGDSRGKR